MRKRILCLCYLIFLWVSSHAQTFEGIIKYHNFYQSKLANLKSEQLNSLMGTSQEYYLKNGDYKSVFNGSFIKAQIYFGKENKAYNLTAKSDTLYWEDYSKNKDEAISYQIQNNKDTIMGIVCNIITIKTAKSKTDYYYNAKYGVNPTLFSFHSYGNWYYIVSKVKALPMKTVYENEQFILTSTAVEIKPMNLSEKIFVIPDKSKIAQATW